MEPLLFLPPGCSPVTCRLCNETIGANVNVVQYHFATTHAETTLPTYSVIFKSIQSIALSHVHTTGNVAVCQACQQPLKAVTVECISRHFRTNHDLKLSTTMVAEWLQQNSMQLTQTTNDVLDSATIPNEDHAETPATLGTPSLSVQQTQVLRCPLPGCNYITTSEGQSSRISLNMHLRRIHSNHQNWQRGEMRQLAFSVAPTQGHFISKRRAVSGSSSTSTSTPATPTFTPTPAPSVSSTFFPHASQNPSPSPSFVSNTDFSTSSPFRHSTVPFVLKHGDFNPIIPPTQAQRLQLQLSTDVQENCSLLFQKLKWFVCDEFYMAICQEGVVSWFSMASQSQHLQLSTLRQAATTFLLQAQQANAVALMIRPSLSGSLTWNEPFDDDDNNRPDTAFNRGLSTLTLPTITRYALVLARAIQFLINLHGDAVSLPTDDELCALDPSQVAHTVCDYLLLSEWPNNVQQPKIGPLAQAAIALSLKDIRGPAHSSTPVTSSRHLGLVSAPELASISSALMSAIKSAVVLARVFNTNQAYGSTECNITPDSSYISVVHF